MFAVNVALRFLTSKKSQTILIILGFAMGIAVNIFVGSLIQSLQDNLIDTTIGDQPHITIKPKEFNGTIDLDNVIPVLQNTSGINSIASISDARAFITNINPDSPDDILIRGVEPKEANEIYNFYNEDSFEGGPITQDNEIIIGMKLKEDLGLTLGDRVEMKINPSPIESGTNTTVVGIFDLGNAAVNGLWVFTNFKTVEKITNKSAINSVNIQINDIFNADLMATEISSKISNDTLVVENWKDTNESLLSGLQAQSSSTLIIQVFVLLAVVIGITSILGITVLQKSRQIGILKAMGLNNFGSAKIFLYQGLFIGVLGALSGLAIATGLIWSFNTFAGGEENGLFTIFISRDLAITTLTVSIISSIFAALFPAKNSSKLEVIDIIRNN